MTPTPDSSYFERLNSVLQQHLPATPRSLVDLDLLDHNVRLLKQDLKDGMPVRLVVKSLPSWSLLSYLSEALDTQRFMVFHQLFLLTMAAHLTTTADVLLGKPMPVQTAADFYQKISQQQTAFHPFRQVQWLVDTVDRLRVYRQLAEQLGQPLRINLEIDVGLHRGGFRTMDTFEQALQLIEQHPQQLQLSGLMGYDPHVVKLPKWLVSPTKAFRSAQERYSAFIQHLRTKHPQFYHSDLTFNGAGSPTFRQHGQSESPLNEVAVGSALLKPATFDIPTLEGYEPACFLATPILKTFQGTRLPGIGQLPTWLKRSWQQSAFIYGGYWKADYCYPPAIEENQLFGPSTNQSMVNAPASSPLQVGNFVFLRPQQSEFVLLQFGSLLVIKNGEIATEWPVFTQ